MSFSFYYSTDELLYTGSISFSEKISATPEAFGLLPADAAAYAVIAENYAGAYRAANSPDTRTKAKVVGKNEARAALRAATAELARKIAGTPSVTDEQKISLGLNVRKRPSPITELGTPGDFKITLQSTGALQLKWKCTNPRSASGILYQIWRCIGEAGEFQYIGIVGGKKYTDYTIPAGSAQVHYRINAARSTATGPVALCTINLGGCTIPPSAMSDRSGLMMAA